MRPTLRRILLFSGLLAVGAVVATPRLRLWFAMKPVGAVALAAKSGGAPLRVTAITLGAGAESRGSMGIAVIGGLVAGGALTLFVIPAIYAMVSARQPVEKKAPQAITEASVELAAK